MSRRYLKSGRGKGSHGKDCGGNTLLAAAKKGDSVLNNAAWKGHLDVVKLLVEAGASLVHKNKIELNALHHASCKGKHETCRYLIEKGINVNSRTKKGTTPLIMASRNGQTETVKVLGNYRSKKDQGDILLVAAKRGDLAEV